MKRHIALHPLSHDHQNALARALRLRKASTLGPEERRAGAVAFLEFVDERITPHFADEEQLLARASDATDAPAVRELRDELVREHDELRATFEALRRDLDAGSELDPDRLHDTGQALTDHIRFEERDLFEQLQRDLPDDVLRAIAEPLEPRDA